MKGLFFIISGPSGVGKGTVIKRLKEKFPAFEYPISCTTREKREGEEHGVNYYFVPMDKFNSYIENGDFLEWAFVHQSNYYGTLKRPIAEALERGKVVVKEMDIQGFRSIRDSFSSEELVSIFINVDSQEKLLYRISNRGELPKEELKKRMDSAKKEFKSAKEFDYQVFNYDDRVDDCVDEIAEIIDREFGMRNK